MTNLQVNANQRGNYREYRLMKVIQGHLDTDSSTEKLWSISANSTKRSFSQRLLKYSTSDISILPLENTNILSRSPYCRFASLEIM